MNIKQAEFIASNTDLAQCPKDKLPEFACIGRSNVGKSSLINRLVGRKKLAKISSTPGKTQTINHYLINGSWYLVDLPGYGYAKTSQTKRAGWSGLIENYILKRENLLCTLALIDSRLPPQVIDLSFMQWLGEKNIPFALIFTKIDKLKRQELQKNIKTYQETLLRHWEILPDIFLTSAEKNIGTDELARFFVHTIARAKNNT